MSLPQRSGPDFTFVGLLVLAAFGALLWTNAPLESSRPTSETEGWYEKEQTTIPARLWQDPFRPVFLHPRAMQLRARTTSSDAKSPETGSAEAQPSHGTHSKETCHILGRSTRDLEAKTRVGVLAVMVTMGSSAELEERRRRRRYAVVSGLGEAGYVPETPDAIQLCQLPGQANTDSLRIPYEWYRLDSSEDDRALDDRVLLLWLDESRFKEKPLERLTNTFERLLSPQPENEAQREDARIFVIGPAQSDTLRKLAKQALKANSSETFKSYFSELEALGVTGFHILSPFATVPGRALMGASNDNAPNPALRELRETISPLQCTQNSNANNKPLCFSFLRTIRTDDILAKELVSELKHRRVDMGSHHIALISEWDTHFGRTLPRAFAKALCKKDDCPSLDHFTYLRGIDGRMPLLPGEEKKSRIETTDTTGNASAEGKNGKIRRPAGTGQFDYLRRLASEVKARDRRYRVDGSGRIRAIGILGSDVYDKLLLLRALRPHFPGVLFFTTDLDAQLLHPSDSRWARNLIIASSFGLRLNDNLQGKTSPFRSSYQTAAYLTTRLATDGKYPRCESGNLQNAPGKPLKCGSQVEFNEYISPLLFEVGRAGAVPLLRDDDQNGVPADDRTDTRETLHPEVQSPNLWPAVFAVFFALAVAVVLLHQIKPASGWLIIALAMALLGALALVSTAVILSESGEPLSVTQGVSVWPTELLRYVTLCLSGFFVANLFTGVKLNCSRLGEQYFGLKPEAPGGGGTLGEIGSSLWASVSKSWRRGSGGQSSAGWIRYESLRRLLKKYLWLACSVVVVVLGLAGMLMTIILGDDFSQLGLVSILACYWTTLIVAWLFVVHKVLDVASINQWVTKALKRARRGPGTSAPGLKAADYWRDYCDLGRPRERFLRALVMWLLYMAIASIIFAVMPAPDAPCRGAACYVDIAVLVVTVFAMLILIFLTLDALRLCIYWIKGLYMDGFCWSGEKLEETCRTLNVTQSVATEWNKIQLIAERTNEIGRLIYYPFAVIVLMLLSRSSYFDNWGLPRAVAIVVVINVGLLVAAGLKLRREAEKARAEGIQTLQQELVSITGTDSNGKREHSHVDKRHDAPERSIAASNRQTLRKPEMTGAKVATAKEHHEVSTEEQIKVLIEYIKEIQIGAFQPFLDQPLLRASLLLFGAMGLSLSEYISLLG